VTSCNQRWGGRKVRSPKAINALRRLGEGPHRLTDIAAEARQAPSAARVTLLRAVDQGRVIRVGKLWQLVEGG
jgi:hypothetical protein